VASAIDSRVPESSICPKCGATDYYVRNGPRIFWLCWNCKHTAAATLEEWKRHGITNNEWRRFVIERDDVQE